MLRGKLFCLPRRTLKVIPLLLEKDQCLDMTRRVLLHAQAHQTSTMPNVINLPLHDPHVETQEFIQKISDLLTQSKWGPGVIESLNKMQVMLNTDQVRDVMKTVKNADTALGFFHWAKGQTGYQHNAATYAELLNILATLREFDTMDVMMQDMLSGELEMSPQVIVAATRTYIKCEMPDVAVSMFLGMQKYGCKPDAEAFNIIIDNLLGTGYHAQAIAVYTSMIHSKYIPSSDLCNTLIDEFSKLGNVDAIIALFQKMKQATEQLDISTYNSLLKVFAELLDVHNLCEVLKMMEGNDCMPTVTTYNIIIGALSKAGNVHAAMKFLDHMKGSGVFPDSFTYSNLIDGLGKISELSEGEVLFERLKHASGTPDDVVYSALIINYVKAGRCKTALEHLQEMRGAGKKPSSSVYLLLVNCMKQVGKPDNVRCVFAAMQKDGFTPHVVAYHELIEMYFSCRERHKAFEVYQEAKHFFPGDVGTYNFMLKQCCLINDRKSFMLVFKDMKAAGFEPSLVTYSMMIQSMGKAGHVKEALEMFKEMRKQGCNPDRVAYANILKAMVDSCQVEKAWPIFEEARRDYPDDLILYSIMIDGFGKVHKFDKAIALLKEMKRNGIEPDVVVFNSLIASLFKVGEVEDAYELYRDMAKYGCKPTRKTKDIVNSLMQKYMRKGAKKCMS